MKRLLSFIMALAMVLTMLPMTALAADTDTTVYLVPNSNWTQANARFAIYCFGNGETWVDMSDADGDGMYEGVVPAGYPSIIFCRMNPSATANNWNNKWNQTADLTLPTDGTNCYTVANGTWDSGGGTWSTVTPEPEEEETEPPTDAPTEPEEETITVYFRNDWLWPEVYVHYWNDSQGTDWPGEQMTFVETTDAGDVYTAEIPAWATSLLFNGLENGNPDNRQQTPDVTSFADGDAFYIHWDGENKVSKFDYTPAGEEPEVPTDPEPTDPPVVEATYIIAGTGELCGSAWDPANTANKMTLNADGLYEKTFESVPKGTHSFKVTDGTWNNCWGGSGTDGNYEFTLDAISNVTITFDASTKAITVSSEATGEVAESVDSFTLHYRNSGLWETVNAYGWLSGTANTVLGAWPGTAVAENADHPYWYTVELTDLAENAGVGILFNNGTGSQTGDIMIKSAGEYWYDGVLLTEAPDTWEDGSVENVTYEVKLHFANTLGWGSVNLYSWGVAGTPTGSWPGTACGLDADGFYSLNFTYEAPEGHGLNFIFNGGAQTVDLALAASDFVDNKAEKWVVPTTADTEGKYYADIVDSPDAIAISPVVDGTTVTFAYKGATTDTVEVYGTMNDWASGYAMTCNEYGVWSITLDDVGYGIHQYKFVVNGNWILDPINSFVITEENGNQNSAFLISNPELDTNTVKINVHYDAPSAEWNVCAWGAPGLEEQYDFVDGVTTITLDGRASQYVAFKVRKSIEGNDWAEQSGEIRIDLGSIVSGTIDVYVGSDFSVKQNLNDDVVYANKISSVEYDYDNNTITVKTGEAVADAETAFAIFKNGEAADIIDTITASGSTYTLTLTQELDLVTLYQYTLRFSEQVNFTDKDYVIGINTVYASDRFAAEFTYDGELGAVWTADSTTFTVWAPTAASVSVNLYESGTEGTDDLIQSVPMAAIGDGAWQVTVDGDLNGTYYTYAVTVDGETVEAVDPYARTTGVNGKRGMVIDLDSTDPDGWAEDKNPNPITSYTDAVIYELHVRDFSIDDSSGVSEANRGKYMAFTEKGTTTAGGAVTGIDYLQSMGITHLHLLPVYDYGSVDETKCENFNWGYDPVNYNTPEGSYSTDPYNGETRVGEFKQMVKSLHDADISVIMDVVYNHVYDAGKFCMNRIVPNYFSRVNADGSFSNGSGCGNDTASEREMVRKYIVESVLYWHQEYHIDGFRFDLVGLLDADTINQIVEEVHACCPDVIFYGEGWTLGTAVEPGNTMATQANSAATPEFAYFSDTIRNLLAGSNGSSLGFVSGLTGQEEAIRDNFMAMPWWSKDPSQIVQYASCHDNYTLIDKLILSTGKSGIDADIIKMNNLAAAIYMTSQGIPFIHAGEEFLREKLEEDGGRCENSYNASDYVNHIEWSNLENETYASNSDYYKGLIAFRKAHEALRMETNEAITANIDYTWVTNEVVMFTIDGVAAGDISDSIAVVFNATNAAKTVTLPEGEWSVCINATQAGTDVIETVSGTVSVDGISAMVLVQGQNDPEHVHQWENGTCAGCGEVCQHTFEEGTCTNCGLVCDHNWNEDYCPDCGTYCGHEWVDGVCTVCGMVCDHAVHWQNGLCSNCLTEVEHEYSENGLCSCGKSLCEHASHNANGMCNDCGLAVGHTMGEDGICTVCGYNQNLMAFLAGSMNGWSTSANALQSIGGTKVAGNLYLSAGTYTFKIVYNNNWYGNSGTINSTASGWVMDSDANCTLNAQYDGMYTFVYDTAENKLDVYAKITETLYVRGTFNEWGTDNALSYSGGAVQTATVTLEAGTYEFKVGNDDWTFAAPAENIVLELDSKSEVTVTATYNGDGTWTVTYETAKVYDAVNSDTGETYLTVQEALDAAEAGQTVKLLTNCVEENVLVPIGVTLDLNGHDLTAAYLVGFEGGHVIDAVGGSRLITGEKNLVLHASNAMVPVYDGKAYLFTAAGFAIRRDTDHTGEGIKINASVCPVNMDVVKLLQDGGTDNNIQIVVQLTWDTDDGTGSQKLLFRDDVVAAVFSSNTGAWDVYTQVFSMVITGYEGIRNLKADMAIVSGTHVQYISTNGISLT